GLSRARYRRKVQSAHVAHVGVLVRELPDTRGEPPAKRVWASSAVVVPFLCAYRHRVGRHWRRDRLLRNSVGLRQIARTIRPPNWQLPTRATKTCLDGAGNHQGAIIAAPPYTPDGGRHIASCADLDGETQQCLDGPAMCAQSAGHAWRWRHHRSIFADSASHESRERLDL